MRVCEITSQRLDEMPGLRAAHHGIPNVIIWVGVTNGAHGMRVKVGTIPGKSIESGSFVIELPSLDYDPRKVPSWITTRTLNEILSWCKLNQDLLDDVYRRKLDPAVFKEICFKV